MELVLTIRLHLSDDPDCQCPVWDSYIESGTLEDKLREVLPERLGVSDVKWFVTGVEVR